MSLIGSVLYRRFHCKCTRVMFDVVFAFFTFLTSYNNIQVINCYMNLLMSACGRRHKVHIMSTFFYTKLVRSGYAGVERWIKRVKLNKLKLLLVPVHLSRSHWALAAVNLRTKVHVHVRTGYLMGRIEDEKILGGSTNSNVIFTNRRSIPWGEASYKCTF